MFLLTPLLALLCIAAIVALWNRAFEPLDRRTILLLVGITFAYNAETLFTPKIDVPADLAYHAYPWKALDHAPAHANSGIIFTQMIPWTETARQEVLRGELPLWNRMIGAGSPLLADLQTTILHPFTLVGLLLPIGEAWTLSVVLRVFWCLFFMFVFLRGWRLHPLAALFGATAYTFSTFHVISLLFPLGLSMMSLPMALVGVDEVLRRPRWRSFTLLTLALALAILGGHPESSVWVALTTGAYCLYSFFVYRGRSEPALVRRDDDPRLGEPAVHHGGAPPARRPERRLPAGSWLSLTVAASAALASALLTAMFWYPAFSILPNTGRYATLTEATPPDHKIGADWMLPLVVPNILGTPPWQDYRTPKPEDPTLPADYGEVAAGYAGALALALAIGAAFCCRDRRPFWFFAGAMIVSFLTIYETPFWYDLIRKIPWVGIALHQRWRFLWALGCAVNGAILLDALLRDAALWTRARLAFIATASFLGAIYFFRWKEFLARGVASHQLLWFAVAAVALTLFYSAARRGRWKLALTVAVVANTLELVAVMFRYNPPSTPQRFYPTTPAIASMQRSVRPYRVAALGWSFIPDTPGMYGLEDVKSTDVVVFRHYMRLFQGFLKTDPSDFNHAIQDVSSPFFDYLGARFLYVPPDVRFQPPGGFQRVYAGADGTVYRNEEALPRYFFAREAVVAATLDDAVPTLREITDYRLKATVDHVPSKISRMSPSLLARRGEMFDGGSLKITQYGGSGATLAVASRGWNLLVSSDVSMPGWRVYWNGERLPPVVVNGAFVGTFVPPGKGVLKLRYFPDEFERGLRIAVITLAALLVAFAVTSAFRRRRRG